jgi:hypothetical protein
MSSDTTVDYTKFEVTKFESPKPEENDRSMGQLVSYPSYNGGSLYLQLPWVKLFTYGIPRLGEYYKTDDDRAHLRVPLDLSVPEIVDFVNKIKAIDAKFSSEEYKEKLFGKKAKKYTYGFKHKADFNEKLETKLLGTFNEYNALAVYAAAVLSGLDKEKVKEVLKMEECELIVNQVTFNKVNTFITTKVELNLYKIVRKFESFNYKNNI